MALQSQLLLTAIFILIYTKYPYKQYRYIEYMQMYDLSTTLLACEMSAIVQYFEHSLGLEGKLTFSSPVATAEFSKFAGILSAALSQHHHSGLDRKSTRLNSSHIATSRMPSSA